MSDKLTRNIGIACAGVLAALVCAVFDRGLAAGVLIGTALAGILFFLTARALQKSLDSGQGNRLSMFLLAPLKILIVAASFLAALSISATAPFGLFIGATAALLGYVLVASRKVT